MHKALRTSMRESLSKALVIFIVAFFVQLAVLCPSSFAYAEENTGEASTEIYLVESDSGTVPAGSSTTITKSNLPSTSDETPIVPFAVVGACARKSKTFVHESHESGLPVVSEDERIKIGRASCRERV